MRGRPGAFVACAFLLLWVAGRTQAPVLPDWPAATPESQGMSGARLKAMTDTLAAHKTRALLVLRNDSIVLEWYEPGRSATARHYTASLAKAIVGGVSVAVALTDGRMALDDPASRFIPEWSAEARKARITMRHLGSHTSGLVDAEEAGLPHDSLTGWKGAFWQRLEPPRDPFTLSRDAAPLAAGPGERMAYSNPGIAMLTYAVTAALRDSAQRDVRALLRERVMRPLEVPDEAWSIGYERTFMVDGLPQVAAWGGGSFTARAVARVGHLMMHEGMWNGRRLLAAGAVRSVTSDAGTPGHGGIGWWNNAEGVDPHLPRDAFWGSGAGHQLLLVVPSLRLVVVRSGEALADAGRAPGEFHAPVSRLLSAPLMDALLDRQATPARGAPYPPSASMGAVHWAPRESIVRLAPGSDNWPLTWAADDSLYGAFGDGRGFEPFVPEKLSLGLARIDGMPPAVRGTNVRAPTLERRGDGAAGPKASGLLSVHGTLYMWVRNVSNSRLAWSVDGGATWSWAAWRFTESFGSPTFLNFGRDYAGARDRFAYVYSADADSAYEPADRMVLARVPIDRIRERDAYEFFVGLAPGGEPVWSRELARRGAVFTHANRVYRSGITYYAPLKRYVWCHVLPESMDSRGPRYQGGFGLYELLPAFVIAGGANLWVNRALRGRRVAA